jgi:hypothetical protein
MKRFRREPSGLLVARFEAAEAALLTNLAAQTAELLSEKRDAPAAVADPALARLLPDAYPDDPEASAEFRRFTSDGLAERKVLNSKAVVDSLEQSDRGRVTVHLDEREAQSLLRTLTDIRLVLAARLGIERDGDSGFRGTRDSLTQSLTYGWVGYVQESLIRALNAPPRR